VAFGSIFSGGYFGAGEDWYAKSPDVAGSRFSRGGNGTADAVHNHRFEPGGVVLQNSGHGSNIPNFVRNVRNGGVDMRT
jgi:hypothetical protein